MPPRSTNDAAHILKSLPPLPLKASHWQAVCKALELSRQQCRIVELLLRSASHKQIATVVGITEPTLKTYLERIAARTGTRGSMQLAMRVLAVSHEVCQEKGVVPAEDTESSRPKS